MSSAEMLHCSPGARRIMYGRCVLIGAALALSGLRAWALPVHLSFDWPSGLPASTAAQVHIHAARLVGDTVSVVPVEADTGPEGMVLDLGQGVWQVQAFAAGYWSQGAEVTVGSQAPAGVRVTFWPAASLHGEIAAQGEPLPPTLEVRLSAAQAPTSQITAAQIVAAQVTAAQASAPLAAPVPAGAELNCRVDSGKWSCLGPAGIFDVRLEASGYAPRYEWGVSLKAAESNDLGQNEFERSLSVFGRAVRKDGSDPPGPCRATLQADAERRGGPGPDPDNPPADEKTFTVPLNQQGYFQIVGAMPGRHLLAVECQFASAFMELQVQPEGETRVDPGMVLEELTLEVAITPRTDPAGQPWKVDVDRTAPRLLRIADTATTSADGHWIRRGLEAGSYRVAVSSSDGMRWLQKDFDLGPGSGPLALRLASVRVAGRVLLNAQPVRARMVFSNQAGGEPVTLSSNDQGGFQGLLPIAADAQESMWIVEAHVAHPQTIRRLVGVDVPTVAAGKSAWLDLALPTIPVRGTVLTEYGRPQSGAQVTFEAAGSGARTAASTDDAGSFEMPDLPPGRYNATAESSYGLSDPTPVAVADGSESQLKLILHPNLRIPFYVVSSEGPISDATVQFWIEPGVPRALGRTDQNGRLEVSLPPGTTEVGMTVGAPDYAIKLTKMPVSSTQAAGESDPSPNRNTVTLDTTGGTLVLNFEPPEGTLDRSATLYLAHNGAIVDARTLAGWGTDQAGANSEGPAQVEGIEPGDYALCVVTDPSKLAMLWQGNVPKELCNMGTLKPGQTLTLAPQ